MSRAWRAGPESAFAALLAGGASRGPADYEVSYYADAEPEGTPPASPLSLTTWFQSLSRDEQWRVHYRLFSDVAASGVEFEAVLQRALLGYADAIPQTDVSRSLIHQEIREEAFHSQMFEDAIAQLGVGGSPDSALVAMAFRIVDWASSQPPMMMLAALAGEGPLDIVQRRASRCQQEHPLIRYVCRVHVADEARHRRFAALEFERTTFSSTPRERRAIEMQGRALIAGTAIALLVPSDAFSRLYQMSIRRDEIDSVVDAYEEIIRAATRGTSALGERLGLDLEPRHTRRRVAKRLESAVS